jgi:hypothetical protein
VIPDEAVEAAALAALEWDYGVLDWAMVDDRTKANYLDKARTVLTAAAQHLISPVLALHKPQGDSYVTCSHCVQPSGYPNRGEQPVRWPCPTIAAIQGVDPL